MLQSGHSGTSQLKRWYKWWPCSWRTLAQPFFEESSNTCARPCLGPLDVTTSSGFCLRAAPLGPHSSSSCSAWAPWSTRPWRALWTVNLWPGSWLALCGTGPSHCGTTPLCWLCYRWCARGIRALFSAGTWSTNSSNGPITRLWLAWWPQLLTSTWYKLTPGQSPRAQARDHFAFQAVLWMGLPPRPLHHPGLRGEIFRADPAGPPSGRPALSIGQGCPGPKSRDIAPYPAQQGLIAVHQCSRITSKAYQRSYVDARVAGSKGHYPAGAPTTFSRLAPLRAKSLGPPVDRSAALAKVTPEDRFAPTPLVNYSPTHFRHNCSSFSMYCTLLVWFVLACLRLRKRVWCRCTHRLLPGLYRRRRAVIGWQQSRLACVASRLAAGLTKAKSSESRPRPACKPSAPPLLWVFKLLLFWFLIVSAHASRDAANHSHGPPATPNLLHAYGCWAQRLSATRKRSFKRAQARVLRTGTTTYRGRLHNAASLALRPLPSVERSPPPQSRPVVPPTCQFLTWNVGGLNAARYQEVLAWLGQQRSTLHVLCVQETKWAQWSEYATPDWYVLNSGSGTSSGGVAFFVNRTFYTQESIKHSEVVPGRLFHLRLLGPTPLDMLGVYQYSWNPQNKAYRSPVTGGTSNPEAALLQQRAQIWLKIRSWTAAVPARHKLLIAGDLNACLQPQSPHVGTGTAVHQSLQHPD